MIVLQLSSALLNANIAITDDNVSKTTYFCHQKVKVMAEEGNVCPAMDSLEEYSPVPANNGPDLMDVRIGGACMEEAPSSNEGDV